VLGERGRCRHCAGRIVCVDLGAGPVWFHHTARLGRLWYVCSLWDLPIRGPVVEVAEPAGVAVGGATVVGSRA
jgi:hypothetical protein